jgi:hypothetical protein
MLGIGLDGEAADGGAGRGAPGIATAGGVFGNSPRLAGIGCRGPERIWPGLGDGTGLAGIADPRATGGAIGNPGAPPGKLVESGGRSGCGFAAGGAISSDTSFVVSVRATSWRGDSGAAGSDLAGACGRTASGVDATGATWATCASWVAGSWASEAEDPPPSPPCSATRRRTSRTTSSSSELEWVFLSATPSTGRRSRITLGLTSSSRASSLMRILLIR